MKYEKVIIIGASSGIGEGLARAFAEEGCKIGILARREELLQKLDADYPNVFLTRVCDITKEEPENYLQPIIDQLGGVDLLILSAGVGYQNMELDPDKEIRTAQTNVVAFTKIMMFTYKYFEKKGEGHIVGISSIAGIRGLDVCPSYSASKGYEALYLESLRRKARKSGLNIKILTVLPGFVDTAMGQGNNVIWRASVKKPVSQIKTAIYKGYGRAYITRRWRVIAWILKFVPRWIFERA